MKYDIYHTEEDFDGFGEEEYEGTYIHSTELAILFLPDGWSEGEEVWLPKSQIDYDDSDYEKGDFISIIVPNWLAAHKEMV